MDGALTQPTCYLEIPNAPMYQRHCTLNREHFLINKVGASTEVLDGDSGPDADTPVDNREGIQLRADSKIE